MPDATPIYGFPYPCLGEPAGAPDIQALALAIDTKGNDINNDYVFALNRPNADVLNIGSQVVPNGVDTLLTTASSTVTILRAGVYAVTAGVDIFGTAATLNMERLRVLQNAVFRFGQTKNPGNELGVPVKAHGAIVAAAGDVITMSYLFNGTGNMTVSATISLKLLCRIA